MGQKVRSQLPVVDPVEAWVSCSKLELGGGGEFC